MTTKQMRKDAIAECQHIASKHDSNGYFELAEVAELCAIRISAIPIPPADPVANAARVLLDWWASKPVTDTRRMVRAFNAMSEAEADQWSQVDAALRAIGGGDA